MEQHWDSYITRVDGELSSIALNLGAAQSPPTAEFPTMAYVRVHMLRPREDGLSSQEEFDDLSAVWDGLEAVIAGGRAILVGRNTGAKRQDYIFYTADLAKFEAAAANAMKQFPAYSFETGGRKDADWSVYFDFLYPSPADFQRMGNRAVCDNLEKHGDNLQAVRMIDHCAYFADAATRLRFLNHIREKGFVITDQYGPDENSNSFALVFSREGAPTDINEIVLPLVEEVEAFGGNYDGWETLVMKSPPAS